MNGSTVRNLSHESLEEAWGQFVAFLRENEARITRSRRYVLEHALNRTDHFRADDIAAALATGKNRVSRGTVYRTLALMVDAGLLRQIRDSDTHVHYEPVWGATHHEHMICDSCGAFIEFSDDDINGRLQHAAEEYGFIQRTHRIVIFGLCSKCAHKR